MTQELIHGYMCIYSFLFCIFVYVFHLCIFIYFYRDKQDVDMSVCDAFADCPIPKFQKEASDSVCTCKYRVISLESNS